MCVCALREENPLTTPLPPLPAAALPCETLFLSAMATQSHCTENCPPFSATEEVGERFLLLRTFFSQVLIKRRRSEEEDVGTHNFCWEGTGHSAKEQVVCTTR